MTFIPNFGNRAPEDGDYSGSSEVWAAVAHSACPAGPGRVADVDDWFSPNYTKFHRMTSSIKIPPQAFIDAALAKEWQADISLSASGVTLTATAETFDWPGEVWSDRINQTGGWVPGETADYSKSADNEVDGGLDTVSVSVQAGDITNAPFGYGDGEWALPVVISVSVSSTSGGYSGTYTSGPNSTVPITSTAMSGVTVTICGESVTLYLIDGNDSFTISGSITLTPTSWLTNYVAP